MGWFKGKSKGNPNPKGKIFGYPSPARILRQTPPRHRLPQGIRSAGPAPAVRRGRGSPANGRPPGAAGVLRDVWAPFGFSVLELVPPFLWQRETNRKSHLSFHVLCCCCFFWGGLTKRHTHFLVNRKKVKDSLVQVFGQHAEPCQDSGERSKGGFRNRRQSNPFWGGFKRQPTGNLLFWGVPSKKKKTLQGYAWSQRDQPSRQPVPRTAGPPVTARPTSTSSQARCPRRKRLKTDLKAATMASEP